MMKKLTYRQLLLRLRKKSINKFEKLMKAEKQLDFESIENIAETGQVKQHSKVMEEWISSHRLFIHLLDFTTKEKINLDEKIKE